MRRLRYLALIILAFLATIRPVGAQNQPAQTVACTTTPILFGNGASFELGGNVNGWAVSSTKWEYQWSVNGCTTAWAGLNPVNFPLPYAGYLTVRCTIQYNNGSGGQVALLKPTNTITVPPPDGVRIVSGNGQSVAFGQFNPTVFQIQCKGTGLTAKDSFYMTGVAQERMTKFKDANGKDVPNLSDEWTPTAVNPPDSLFFLSNGGQIIDKKLAGNRQENIDAPPGTRFTVHQDLRIYILSPCNTWTGPFSLGPGYDVTVTKNPNGTYQITHQ